MLHRFSGFLVVSLVAISGSTQLLAAQNDNQSTADASALPTIANEPKSIDPATLMPEKLAAKVTVDFTDSSLRELVAWLRDEQGLAALIDERALADLDILPSDPVVDWVEEAPLYLLLNRLRLRDISWYYDNDILHLSSPDVASGKLVTQPHNVADLLDKGYQIDDLSVVIAASVAPDSWEQLGGNGILTFLGDVMFVRQTDENQRRIQGLLEAFRKHARQTFVFDPLQHQRLREKLKQKVAIDFDETPFEDAIDELAKKSDADIRLDLPALRRSRFRDRKPITLQLAEHDLKTVLDAIVVGQDLTWMLRDGVLWITTSERADEHLKTAVYDVRDLARDESESAALSEAVLNQTDQSEWETFGGPGTLKFARPGTMVILNHEHVHLDVLRLLQGYRQALRESKRRDRQRLDPQEVITVYYQTHRQIAEDLLTILPQLVRSSSWNTPDRQEATGTILLSASRPEIFGSDKQSATEGREGDGAGLLVPRAVLIIRQTREVHEEIAEVISRVEQGDATDDIGAEQGGMGGGMGGFGGGFF